jgi:arylsulfatase A-like enzyme
VAKQPNFILFITDQHHADFLGCNGHSLVKTPNIDEIAAAGMSFDRFYVSSPVCMPNRASLMTGRMPSVHGVRSNGIPLSMEAVTLVDLLRDAGYATGLIGKSHLQNFTGRAPLSPNSNPAEGSTPPLPENARALRHDNKAPVYNQESPTFWSDPSNRVETPFYGFDHVEPVTGHGDGVGGDYARWLTERHPAPGSLIGVENQLPHDYICPRRSGPRTPRNYTPAIISASGPAPSSPSNPPRISRFS